MLFLKSIPQISCNIARDKLNCVYNSTVEINLCYSVFIRRDYDSCMIRRYVIIRDYHLKFVRNELQIRKFGLFS